MFLIIWQTFSRTGEFKTKETRNRGYAPRHSQYHRCTETSNVHLNSEEV